MRNSHFVFSRLSTLVPAAVSALLLAGGCAREEAVVPERPAEEFSLRLVTDDPLTRSAGEDPFNENLINRAIIFFYPQGATYDTEAIYCWKEGSLEKPLGSTGKHEVTVLKISDDLREKIFGPDGDKEGRVFAVVNLPDGVVISEKASVNQIRQTVVTADFRSKSEESTVVAPGTTFDGEMGIQPEFVMLGEAMLKFEEGETKNVYGEIPLTRTAAKIRLALRVKDVIEDFDPTEGEPIVMEEWEPLTSGMRVYITNGVNMAHVGGAQFSREALEAADAYYKISAGSQSTSSDGSTDSRTDYETIARKVQDHTDMRNFPDEMKGTPVEGSDEEPGDFVFWHDIPFYSYPHQWENTPYEDRQTYLVVQVPWRKVAEPGSGEQDYKTFYYQVPINLRGGQVTEDDEDGYVDKDRTPADQGGFANAGEWMTPANTIESNMYYLVKLDVGMLGSFNPEEPLTLEAQYYVVPWQEERIEAILRDNRYLVVNDNYWTMNNETDLDVPFFTSHETVVARVKFRFWNFNPVGVRTYNGQGVPTAWYTYTDDGDEFTINYEGAELRRTFYWKAPRAKYDNGTDSSAVYNKTYELTGEKLFEVTLDNDKLNIHYHHDLKRWTEYIAQTNGSEVRLFSERTTNAFTRDLYGNTASYAKTTDDNGNPYTVDGYYGQFNGTSDALNLGTTHLKKTLDANGNEEDEWSIISVEITVIHKDLFEDPNVNYLDNTRFQQTIYITQYPQMYIEADRSAVNGATSVIVNNNKTAQSGVSLWKSVSQGESTNNNPNMYVITITQLDDPSLKIGDPRTLSPNNNLSNNSFSGGSTTSWTGGSGTSYYVNDEKSYHGYDWPHQTHNWTTDRPKNQSDQNYTLQNYYPTDESTGVGSKSSFVAPKLRIASSYGNTSGQFDRTMARRRCASYQEKDRPAGRWRLPTLAEIQFITQLSSKGRIPLLFAKWNAQAIYQGKPIIHGTDGTNNHTDYYNYPHYWSAQGAAYVDGADGIVKLFPAPLYLDPSIGTGPNGNNRYQVDASADAASKTENAVQVAVRCVYDEWYWTDTCTPGIFTWGDKSKENPQN